jgi:hypothetical protein
MPVFFPRSRSSARKGICAFWGPRRAIPGPMEVERARLGVVGRGGGRVVVVVEEGLWAEDGIVGR